MRSAFGLAVVFDYYDGPESGLLVLSDGQAARFDFVADSPSRMTRAFAVTKLNGMWLESIASFRSEGQQSAIVVPSASAALSALIEDVSGAAATAHYVAIADLALTQYRACPVTESEQLALLATDGAATAYLLVRNMTRSRQSACESVR